MYVTMHAYMYVLCMQEIPCFFVSQRFIFVFTRVRLRTSPNLDDYITRPCIVSLKCILGLPNTPM